MLERRKLFSVSPIDADSLTQLNQSYAVLTEAIAPISTSPSAVPSELEFNHPYENMVAPGLGSRFEDTLPGINENIGHMPLINGPIETLVPARDYVRDMYASSDFAQEFFNRGVVHDMDQSEIAAEMMQGAGEEAFGYAISTWGSRFWGSIFGGASLAIDASQTAAKGATGVCKDLAVKQERWSQIEQFEDSDVDTCPELVGNEKQTTTQENDTEQSTTSGDTGASSTNDEDEECFPPIILEQLYGDLGREEIQFDHLGHDNLASFVDVREMIPTQNHFTQSFVSTYNYANNYTRNQAFQNWH